MKKIYFTIAFFTIGFVVVAIVAAFNHSKFDISDFPIFDIGDASNKSNSNGFNKLGHAFVYEKDKNNNLDFPDEELLIAKNNNNSGQISGSSDDSLHMDGGMGSGGKATDSNDENGDDKNSCNQFAWNNQFNHSFIWRNGLTSVQGTTGSSSPFTAGPISTSQPGGSGNGPSPEESGNGSCPDDRSGSKPSPDESETSPCPDGNGTPEIIEDINCFLPPDSGCEPKFPCGPDDEDPLVICDLDPMGGSGPGPEYPCEQAPQPTPEPISILLFGSGLLSFGVLRRKLKLF